MTRSMLPRRRSVFLMLYSAWTRQPGSADGKAYSLAAPPSSPSTLLDRPESVATRTSSNRAARNREPWPCRPAGSRIVPNIRDSVFSFLWMKWKKSSKMENCVARRRSSSAWADRAISMAGARPAKKRRRRSCNAAACDSRARSASSSRAGAGATASRSPPRNSGRRVLGSDESISDGSVSLDPGLWRERHRDWLCGRGCAPLVVAGPGPPARDRPEEPSRPPARHGHQGQRAPRTRWAQWIWQNCGTGGISPGKGGEAGSVIRTRGAELGVVAEECIWP